MNISSTDISEALAASNGKLAYTPSEQEVKDVVTDFLKVQPNWVQNAIDHDAAVNTKPKGEAISEVLKYQGLHALAFHQKAHKLYTDGKAEQDESKLVEARNISQGVRRLTAGIEIHPGAKIGENCFIDHGSSLVIGETAEIGKNVFIYHGVTLGALDGKHDNGGRRHPKIGNNVTISNGVQILGPATIQDDVTIAADAKIIGNVTIGKGAKIASGVEVRRDIAAGEIVVGAVPNLPGITTKEEAYAPITVPKNDIKVEGLQWYGTLTKALKQMLGLGGQPATS